MATPRTLALAKCLPFLAFIAMMVVEGLTSFLWPAAHQKMLHLWYPLRVLAAVLALAYFWNLRAEYWPVFRRLTFRDTAIACLVGSAVIGFWILIGPLTRIGTTTGLNPIPEGKDAAYLWLGIRFFGTALLIPVIEELFWRSYVMRRIDSEKVDDLAPIKVSWTAIGLSSFAFALEHKEIVAGFVAGLAFAWLYRRSGNLREAILAHALANALLFLYVIKYEAFHFWN